MTPWEKLEWLRKSCVEVNVSTNEHRGCYETVEQHLVGHGPDELFDEDDAAIRAECIARNELVTVQVYPDTPGGFYRVGHYDMGEAIGIAYDCVVREREKNAKHMAGGAS